MLKASAETRGTNASACGEVSIQSHFAMCMSYTYVIQSESHFAEGICIAFDFILNDF